MNKFVVTLIFTLGSAASAAAQVPAPVPPAATAQQAQPVVSSPAPQAVPAAPAPPHIYAPVIVAAPRPYPPPPHRVTMPPVHPLRSRVYGDAGAPFSLGLGGDAIWRKDQDVHGAFDAFASYDVWAPSRAFVLSAGLSYRHDKHTRNQLAYFNDNLLTAELTGRIRATSWLWPHVRAGVGFATTQLTVKDRVANVDFDDRATGAAGSFGGGFTLRTPTRAMETRRGKLASLSFGVMVEGGYTVAQDAELKLEPAHGGDVRRVSSAALKFERSAAYLRILFVTRF